MRYPLRLGTLVRSVSRNSILANRRKWRWITLAKPVTFCTLMCGIVGIIGAPTAGREAFLGLTTLQHRGQDAAGILTVDESGFHRVRNIGLVESVFNQDNMATLTGSFALGHARYSTAGHGGVSEVQPMVLSYPYGLGLVHNGNLVNTQSLSKLLKSKYRRTSVTSSDSELLLNTLAEGLAQSSLGGATHRTEPTPTTERLEFDQICRAVKFVYDNVVGSFSVAVAIADHGLLAFRDPNGIRPLVYGRKGDSTMVASESVALEFNGYEKIANIAPGEVLFIGLDGKVERRVIARREARPCMFEWIYFASPESDLDGVPVYGARIQLGRMLAPLLEERLERLGVNADLIVPVPETARIAAIAIAEELGVPYREVLIKNRYIKRTFILNTPDKRQTAVNLKLSPVRSELKDKVVVLVDDSIVRGTTSRKIIELVRSAGAAKVIFVSTCPPIQHSCFYGIDFPDRRELLAFERDLHSIEKELGADAVVYQDIEALRLAIDSARTNGTQPGGGVSAGSEFRPCMACLNGQYPTDVSEGAVLSQQRIRDREKQA